MAAFHGHASVDGRRWVCSAWADAAARRLSATPLSVDHQAGCPHEQAELKALHPGQVSPPPPSFARPLPTAALDSRSTASPHRTTCW
jgi:hypothetical protein